MKGLYRGLAGRPCSSDKSKWLWQNISRPGGSPKPQARLCSLAPFGLHHGLLTWEDVFHVCSGSLSMRGPAFQNPRQERLQSDLSWACEGPVSSVYPGDRAFLLKEGRVSGAVSKCHTMLSATQGPTALVCPGLERRMSCEPLSLRGRRMGRLMCSSLGVLGSPGTSRTTIQ